MSNIFLIFYVTIAKEGIGLGVLTLVALIAVVKIVMLNEKKNMKPVDVGKNTEPKSTTQAIVL